MAYQSIGRGTSANDGTGDDLRTGAGKVNANFVELYTYLGTGSALSADPVVTLAATQTLTGKTITGTFTGNITGDVTGNVSTTSGNLQLNAATQIVEVRGDGSATEGQVILNCETNAHGQTIKPQPHSAAVTNTMLLPAGADSTLVSEVATQTLTNKTLTSPTITGTGAIAGTFTGDITGDVTGDVTGNLTGDVTGDVTGNLTGDVTGDVTGNLTGNVTGNVDGQVTLSEASLTGDGSTVLVVDPTLGVTLITSSASAETATLADASVVGTTINIILEVDGGGDVTLTPTTFLNGSTITFADAGDQVTLVWTGSNGWAMIGAGFGAPAIA